MPSFESFVKGTLGTAVGISSVGVGLLYYGQNFLIYPSAFPQGSRNEVPVPTDFGLDHEDLTLHTSDDINIKTFLLLQKKEISQNHAMPIQYEDSDSDEDFASKRPTVIMFHGNGGNHGHRIPLAKVFYVKMRCNVLLLSYRGYGHSEGTPSEKGLRIDAQTVLDYVKDSPCLSKTPVILFGQSIGGAVAIDLTSRNSAAISALILENTFTSIPNLIPSILPLLKPVSFLCHQKWESIDKVPLIPKDTPVLLLSGLKDEVVPAVHMAELWEAFETRKGKALENGDKSVRRAESIFKTFEDGAHNDTFVQPGYWTAVTDFVDNFGNPSRSG